MTESTEERKKALAQKAARLARSQGVKWKDLEPAQRREFKQKVQAMEVEQRKSRQGTAN